MLSARPRVALLLSRSLLGRLSQLALYSNGAEETKVCRALFRRVYRCHADITRALGVFYR